MYCPSGQLSGAELPLRGHRWPAGHAWQAVDLRGANCPGGQTVGDVPFGHSYPSGHIVHVALPTAL